MFRKEFKVGIAAGNGNRVFFYTPDFLVYLILELICLRKLLERSFSLN